MSTAASHSSSFVDGVASARGALVSVNDSPVWQLSGDVVVEQLRALTALQAQVDAAVLRLVGEVDGRGLHVGVARSAAGWVAACTRREMGACRDLVELAAATSRACPATGAALAAGELSAAHARAVVAALQALPALVDADTREDVEALLVQQAGQTDPAGLRRIGRSLLERLARYAPDVDDAGELAALDAADRAAEAAAARRTLDLTRRPDGTWSVRGLLDPLTGAALATALEPLAAPQPAPDGTPDPRSHGQRQVDGLASLLDLALDAGRIGDVGGERPHVTVTMDLAELQRMHAGGIGGAELATGGTLSPGALRTILCDARILPVVLGGASQPVDVGRAARTFSPAQRRALAARDRGCVWPGCDAPVARSHAHHLVHWVDGGPTDLANAALLCPRHHRQLHQQGWEARLAPNGRPEVVPPYRIDPQRRPRQHHRWHTLGHSRTHPPDRR